MSREDRWLHSLKQILALAETGQAFARDPFDLERYEALTALARDLLADLATLPISVFEQSDPIIKDRYATPMVEVRAAVFKQGKILLVQEKADERWTLPGGYADIGLSAAENAVKETLEESGVRVVASDIYSLRHKAKGDYDADVRDFYKIRLLCQLVDDSQMSPGPETLAADYFSLDKLPPLSTGRTNQQDIDDAVAAAAQQTVRCQFDN